jgi:hypothetical protein
MQDEEGLVEASRRPRRSGVEAHLRVDGRHT